MDMGCFSFNLDAGSHTLTITYREDGAKLDKLWITITEAETSGEGNAARNWDDVSVVDDFAKAIRYPENPEKMLAKYSNDWLHPNTEGYAFLGKSVDLDLFTEIENNRTVFADAGSSQTVIDYGNLIIRKNCKMQKWCETPQISFPVFTM